MEAVIPADGVSDHMQAAKDWNFTLLILLKEYLNIQIFACDAVNALTQAHPPP